MKAEKVYAAVSFNDETNEWVNLVLTENGYMVMCLIYAADEEEKCRYEMVEISKSRLNQRNQDRATKLSKYVKEPCVVGSFEIIVVDKRDERFVVARALHEKEDAKRSSIFFKVWHKITFPYVLLKYKVRCGLAYLIEKIEPYLDLH